MKRRNTSKKPKSLCGIDNRNTAPIFPLTRIRGKLTVDNIAEFLAKNLDDVQCGLMQRVMTRRDEVELIKNAAVASTLETVLRAIYMRA